MGAPVCRGDLIHYSDGPIGAPYNVAQRPECEGYRNSSYEKPRGLWLSVLGRSDWASWCRGERFRSTRQQHASRIHLRSGHQVLRLTGARDLDTFTAQYGDDHQWGGISGRQYTDRYIAWERVAADWQGLIIAPYTWSRRLELNWYYGWDCASGCVWDAGAIEAVEVLRAPVQRDTPSAPAVSAAGATPHGSTRGHHDPF